MIRSLSAAILGLFLTGCWSAAEREVVVYVALDREFSEPILRQFETETGIRVLAKYDVESTKTVGLVNAILQERAHPRCDVFWNNEILHTLRLRKLGLLAPCPAPPANDWPRDYRDSEDQWFGLAARARVLIVNTQLVPRDQWPDSIEDLIDPRWTNQVGIAKPLFGTTATHAAALFAVWGDERAKSFFTRLKGNARVLSGNKQVASSVGSGQLAFGLTDTDDAIIERDQGRPVAIIFPDQADGAAGTLFIPNSIGAIRGSPHPEEARRLIEFLLQPRIEEQLARGSSAQFPVNPAVKVRSRVAPETPIRWQTVDFSAAAESWNSAARFLRDEFTAAP